MIVCRTLGPVEVTVNGAAAPRALTWNKHLALLIYLARSPKRVRTREHLIGLLWSEKPEGPARGSLNEAVRILRQSVGDGLESDATQVRLAPGAVTLDLDTFEALVGGGDNAGAAALVAGEFLEGFSVEGASEFDNWLAAEREHWRRRSVDVSVRHAEQLLASGQVGTALDVLQRARKLDWRPETALRAEMRALALAGDRAGALAARERFAARLQSELGAEPDAETAALAERIRREKRRPMPRPAPVESEASRPPLVGRAHDLAQLGAAWNACRANRKAMVAVIEGDAGTGKTRLAAELAARARLDGAVVAGVRAVEGDRGDPWSGVRGITRGGLLDAPGVAGAPPAALALLRGGTPDAGLGRALSEVLQAIAEEQPVLVVVDDAHLLDRESLLALGGAVRDLAGAPIGLLLNTALRAACPELDELRARLERDVAGTTVKLGVFANESVRELARWALPTYDAEQLDRVTRRVLADSAGIPLLVVALLQAVVLGLELRDSQVVWPMPMETLSQTLPGQLADNVVAAIRVTFRRLSSNAQTVLVAAAVLGGRVDGATLERAAGVAGTALAGALDELEWQGWLVAEPRGYVFVARIVRDVIDRDMVTGEGQRRRIRDAAGEYS
jgi:DNA-binding SARP family transcriptional activator